MTEREKFEKWCKANKYTALYFSDNMYFDKATQMAWKAWQAAKATSFTLPERMDYELHGDKVINDPFADGYNQALSDVISMNEEYANSTGSDGWKLVPVEPTPEMMLHGSDCQHHAWNDKECPMRTSRRSIWKHMCEAAPELNKAGAQ